MKKVKRHTGFCSGSVKDFTHGKTWASGLGYDTKEDISHFKFLQKTCHILQHITSKYSKYVSNDSHLNGKYVLVKWKT